MFTRLIAATAVLLLFVTNSPLQAQQAAALADGGGEGAGEFDSTAFYTQVKTYVNPVLGGDHPDPTMVKIGDNFYMCGSTFHFNPYLPILHSKDLVHWQKISQVVPPDRAELKIGKPDAGI